MKLYELGATIESLSGVGKATAKLFANLNIWTIADLLSTFPRDYEDRTQRIELKDYLHFPKVHTICKVMSHHWIGYGRMKTLKIAITDGTANAYLIAFNRPFLEKTLPKGSIIAVTGKFEVRYNELQSSSFDAERISYEGNICDFQNTAIPNSEVFPIYSLTEGLTQKIYRKAIIAALKQYAKNIDNELPISVIKERKLLDKNLTIQFIHQPKTLLQATEAKKTLIYEELYFFEYKMAERALKHRGTLPAIDIQMPTAYPFFATPDSKSGIDQIKTQFEQSLSPRQVKLYKQLSFELTLDQMTSIIEMNHDIDKSQTECNTMLNNPEKLEHPPFSMQRLLQGDVGSGKTLVSFFICARTIDYGGQCAILAPTELLARQHAENAAKLLSPIDIKVAFLTGNLKSSGRQQLVNFLRDGNIDIVIGTHALFSPNVQYKNLKLAVIDEQHRFGVTQRESIIAKGRITYKSISHSPDLLMMSATPIPQTLALTAFGDLDSSIIKTMPKGRLPVKTYLTVFGNEKNVYEAIRKEIQNGHQAYFVYPRIGEDTEQNNDDNSIKSAQEMFNFLSTKVYPNFKCALIHGKIEEEEQTKILKDFSNGIIQILIATTVVEVGVDVANATCIAIEHADRFGLAELHQLRGRVGRGTFQSYCFLTYDKNITEAGIARLKALHQSNDGFFIAEEDLKLRGPGEVFGTMQSGYMTLNVADLIRDKEILKIARYDAFKQIQAT